MSFRMIDFAKNFTCSPYMPYALGVGGFCVSIAVFRHYHDATSKNSNRTFFENPKQKLKTWVKPFLLSVLAGALVTIAALDFKKLGVFASWFFQTAQFLFFFVIFVTAVNLILTTYSFFRKRG